MMSVILSRVHVCRLSCSLSSTVSCSLSSTAGCSSWTLMSPVCRLSSTVSSSSWTMSWAQLTRGRSVSTSAPLPHSIEAHPLRSVFCAQKRSLYLHTSLRNKLKPEDSGQLSSSRLGSEQNLSAAQKVKEAGKDFTYLIVVLIGLGVTGGLLYVVFQELFSSSSPSKIYGKAFDKTRLNPEVIGAFGEPIKCYGETTRRGRRQQVSHAEFVKDGLKHMRLKFYIEGEEPGRKGTVHSESKENPETGKYEFRYIFVEVDGYPRRTIVVEDNR